MRVIALEEHFLFEDLVDKIPVSARVARGFPPRTRSRPRQAAWRSGLGPYRRHGPGRHYNADPVLFRSGAGSAGRRRGCGSGARDERQARRGHRQTSRSLWRLRASAAPKRRGARRKSFAARFGSSVSAARSSMARRRTDFLTTLVSRPSCRWRKTLTRRSISIRIFRPKPCARPISTDFRAPREISSRGRAGDGTRRPLCTFCGWSWRERSTGIRS